MNWRIIKHDLLQMRAKLCVCTFRGKTVMKTGKEGQCVSYFHYEDSLCENDNKERKCLV